ncbi:unnamed protein product, partial [Iphiclides podalirius]
MTPGRERALRRQTMEYVVRDGSPVLLYRVRRGQAGASLALDAAKGAGLGPLLPRAAAVATSLQVTTTTTTTAPPQVTAEVYVPRALANNSNRLNLSA